MNNPDAPGLLDPVSQCIAELGSGACFIYILHNLVGWAALAYHHETRMKPAPKGPVSMLPHKRFMFVSGKETLLG
jgi:hypothetical protein